MAESRLSPENAARAKSAHLGGRFALAGWAIAIVALGLAAAAWFRHPAPLPTRRFDLTFGAFTPVSSYEVQVSPDGSMLAASGRMRDERAIFIRHLDGDAEFRKVPGTEGGEYPAFSPDNQWIVFRRNTDRTLVKVNINTGNTVVLVNSAQFSPFFPDWAGDGRIVFTGPTGVGILDAAGGPPRRLPKIPAVRPSLLPDGSGVLFDGGTNVMLYDFKSDSNYVLLPGLHATYVESGQLLYSAVSGGLFAVPFDLAHHRITGPSVRVLERVFVTSSGRGYAVSRNGLLVHHDAAAVADNEVVIAGLGKSADTLRLPPGIHTDPRFAADGKRIAMAVAQPGHAGSDIYTVDLAAGAFTQLTFGGSNVTPAWSPDGRTIAYSKNTQDSAGVRDGYDIFVKPADNSGPERRITSMVSAFIRVAQWIDDKHVLISARVGSGNYHIFTVSTDARTAPREPAEYMESPVSETEPRLSPDGKLLAYASSESGQGEVWMRDFPTPHGKWNLSAGTGNAPRWTPDGKAVLFWRGSSVVDSLFRVRIDRTPAVVIHPPELVTTLRTALSTDWSLRSDGQRFVATVPAPSAGANGTTDRYLIVENWFTELRRLMGGGPQPK